MTEIFKISGALILAGVLYLIIKNIHAPLAPLVASACVLMCALFALSKMADIVTFITATCGNANASVCEVLLKIFAISLMCEITSDVLTEISPVIAKCSLVLGRILTVVSVLPTAGELIKLCTGYLK